MWIILAKIPVFVYLLLSFHSVNQSRGPLAIPSPFHHLSYAAAPLAKDSICLLVVMTISGICVGIG